MGIERREVQFEPGLGNRGSRVNLTRQVFNLKKKKNAHERSGVMCLTAGMKTE